MTRIHPEDWTRVETAVRSALRQGSDYREEHQVRYPNGVVRWLHVIGSCHLNAQGQPARMLGASLDITERRDHETLLRNALAEVRRLQAQLRQENLYLQQEVKSSQGHGRIVGQSPALRRVLTQVEPRSKAAWPGSVCTATRPAKL